MDSIGKSVLKTTATPDIFLHSHDKIKAKEALDIKKRNKEKEKLNRNNIEQQVITSVNSVVKSAKINKVCETYLSIKPKCNINNLSVKNNVYGKNIILPPVINTTNCINTNNNIKFVSQSSKIDFNKIKNNLNKNLVQTSYYLDTKLNPHSFNAMPVQSKNLSFDNNTKPLSFPADVNIKNGNESNNVMPQSDIEIKGSKLNYNKKINNTNLKNYNDTDKKNVSSENKKKLCDLNEINLEKKDNNYVYLNESCADCESYKFQDNCTGCKVNRKCKNLCCVATEHKDIYELTKGLHLTNLKRKISVALNNTLQSNSCICPIDNCHKNVENISAANIGATNEKTIKRKILSECNSPIKRKKSQIQALLCAKSSIITDTESCNNDVFKLKQNLDQKELENKKLKDEISWLQEEVNSKEKIINKIFRSDQLKVLKENNSKGYKWSNETVKEALQLKFSCGSTGYQTLLDKKFPLPSIRTLQRKIEHIQFKPGILKEVFSVMSHKVEVMDPDDRDCSLLLDEATIQMSHIFDEATREFIGNVTFPNNHDGLASKALVFMLSGIKARWKQVICYHFTPESFNGVELKSIIIDIITHAENIGLKVHNVISDMAPCNMAMFKSFGIICKENVVTNFQTKHPCDEKRHLSFMPDPVHIYKNMRSSIENNETLTLAPHIVQKYNLKSNTIKMDHFRFLLEQQINDDLKLAPKFDESSMKPNTWEKMKVKTTHNMLHHNTGSGLEYLSEVTNNKDLATTGWFVKIVHKWFRLVTNRSLVRAFSLKIESKFKENIQFLIDFVAIIQNLEIGKKGIWKPVQTGIKLCTTTILYLVNYFIIEKKYDFLFTGNLTQCCLENVFSIVRSKHPVPTALQFKQDLKILSISQYMKSIKNSCYDDAKCHSLADFFTCKRKVILPLTDVTKQNKPQNTINWKKCKLSLNQQNALYSACGFIVFSVQNYQKCCTKCFDGIISPTMVKETYTILLQKREFSENIMIYVTKHAFKFFSILEQIFMTSKLHMGKKGVDSLSFLIDQYNSCSILQNLSFPNDCHNIKFKLMKRFFTFRLHISNKSINNKLKKFYSAEPKKAGSKTVAQYSYTKR